MGYKLIKHLESAGYNRKLFYLDNGEADLPPIGRDKNDIQPGSEARSLSTGQKWVLNTKFEWVYVKENAVEELPAPTVFEVDVSPSILSLGRGDVATFSADVKGSNSPHQGVNWTIKGKHATETKITSGGTLTISSTESAETLTIRATSMADATKYGETVVKIVAATVGPVVTGITISPNIVTVYKGAEALFGATVLGINNPSNEVLWAVEGNSSANTHISNGRLVVGVDEENMVLTVRATASIDRSKVIAASVIVLTPNELVPNVTGVAINPAFAEVVKGDTTSFVATVSGVNLLTTDVVWAIEGSVSPKTTITNNGVVTIDKDETASSIMIKATSVSDPSKFAMVTISVIAGTSGVATVTGISVSPSSVNVFKGESAGFSAVVMGNNGPSQAVKWSLDGNLSPMTKIDNSGFLTLGVGEAANFLVVKAISVADSTKIGTAIVGVLTMEDKIGDLARLKTNAKTNLVDAVNEIFNDIRLSTYTPVTAYRPDDVIVSPLSQRLGIVQEPFTSGNGTISDWNTQIMRGHIIETGAGSGGDSIWGSIQGNINNQADLMALFAGEANLRQAEDQRLDSAKPNNTELTAIITDINFNATTSKVDLTFQLYNSVTKATSSVTKTIPVVSSSNAGLMLPSMFDALTNAVNDIRALQEKGGLFIGTSFETKAQMDATPIPAGAKDGDYTYVLKDETRENATSMYIVIDVGTPSVPNLQYAFALEVSSAPIGTATAAKLGLVKSSDGSTPGTGFVEVDGTISIVGWDALNNSAMFKNVYDPSNRNIDVFQYIDDKFAGIVVDTTLQARLEGGL